MTRNAPDLALHQAGRVFQGAAALPALGKPLFFNM